MCYQSFQRVCFHLVMVTISTFIISSWAIWIDNIGSCYSHKECHPDYFCNLPTNKCKKCVECSMLDFDEVVILCPTNPRGVICSTCPLGLFEDEKGDCNINFAKLAPFLHNMTALGNSTRRYRAYPPVQTSDFTAWNIIRIGFSVLILICVFRAWILMSWRRRVAAKEYYRKLRTAFLLTEEEYEKLEPPFHSSSSSGKFRLF